MGDEVVKRDPTIMEIVQQIAASPNARDQVDVMKELLAMKERIEDREAKQAFAAAKHQMEAKIHVTKDGVILGKSGEIRSRYTSMDQLDSALKPLMDEYGFSFSVSQLGVKEGMREFAGYLLHEKGYEDMKTLQLPLDKSDFRSLVQSESSTLSYARRLLLKMHFNITEHGEDNPQNVEPIDAEQLKDLETVMQDVKANKTIFCNYFGITKVADLKKADLAKAIEMLQRKKAKKNEDPSM